MSGGQQGTNQLASLLGNYGWNTQQPQQPAFGIQGNAAPGAPSYPGLYGGGWNQLAQLMAGPNYQAVGPAAANNPAPHPPNPGATGAGPGGAVATPGTPGIGIGGGGLPYNPGAGGQGPAGAMAPMRSNYGIAPWQFSHLGNYIS